MIFSIIYTYAMLFIFEIMNARIILLWIIKIVCYRENSLSFYVSERFKMLAEPQQFRMQNDIYAIERNRFQKAVIIRLTADNTVVPLCNDRFEARDRPRRSEG